MRKRMIKPQVTLMLSCIYRDYPKTLSSRIDNFSDALFLFYALSLFPRIIGNHLKKTTMNDDDSDDDDENICGKRRAYGCFKMI